MKIAHTLLVMAAVARIGAAAELTWKTDASATKVTWVLGDVLHTVKGTFQLRSGTIRFDPDSGRAGGELVVAAASGESGSGARDGRMKKQILEADKYPDIVFAPDRVDGKVDLQGESTVQVHGMFTIHGTPHEITIPARVKADGQKWSATLNFQVPYVKWGMKNPSNFLLRVNEYVDISIDAAGTVAPR